jgi:hypothetical protein
MSMPKKTLRTNFIVDGKFQGTWILAFIGAMLAGAALVTGVLSFVPDSSLRGLEGPQAIRGFIMKLNAAYFCFGSLLVLLMTISLTHRVAGAARVLTQAVRGFREGDFSGRLKLRQRDYLQDLAGELRAFAETHAKSRRLQLQKLRQLESALGAGDHRRALALTIELQGREASLADRTSPTTEPSTP